jgi:hypothetical protein
MYTWRNHATKVSDTEDLLRQAIRRYHALPSQAATREEGARIKALAKRLLSARARYLKAREVEVGRVGTEESATLHATEIASLRRRQVELAAGGIAGLLREFGMAEDLLCNPAVEDPAPGSPLQRLKGEKDA